MVVFLRWSFLKAEKVPLEKVPHLAAFSCQRVCAGNTGVFGGGVSGSSRRGGGVWIFDEGTLSFGLSAAKAVTRSLGRRDGFRASCLFQFS
jgi:hypothetical protein